MKFLDLPNLCNPLEDTLARRGETAYLRCVYDGSPVPRVQWYVNGVEVVHSTSKHAIVHDRIQRTVALRISNVTEPDTEASYMCVLTNQVGQSRASAEIRLHVSRMLIFDHLGTRQVV